MCMRKSVLKYGEKVFHVLVILGFVFGVVSAVLSGMQFGANSMGAIAAVTQLVLSWSGTLIVALIVYALLDAKNLNKCCCCGSCNCECHKKSNNQHNA